jgi:hypothetical protein
VQCRIKQGRSVQLNTHSVMVLAQLIEVSMDRNNASGAASRRDTEDCTVQKGHYRTAHVMQGLKPLMQCAVLCGFGAELHAWACKA